MSTTAPLSVNGFVTLDSSGNGTVKLGPASAREIWNPAYVHVQVTGPVTNEAVCTIYVGDSATQGNFRDATVSGSSGDGSDKVSADTVKCGQYVWAVWAGGDTGRQATLLVTGSKQI
jgi:hypothetical protein